MVTLPSMRKVVLWIGMSVDGFTSGVNERLDWLVPHATQSRGRGESPDGCGSGATQTLMGRVNYEGFVGYWPQVKERSQASRMGRRPYPAGWTGRFPQGRILAHAT